MSTTAVRNLGIAAIGDKELVDGLRLVGISKYCIVQDDRNIAGDVRKALNEFLADADVGVIVILEGYAEYVEDLMTRVRQDKRTTPVIIEVPSKFGTKYPDIVGYYKEFARQFIGFDIEI
ncbi:MAG: V-type ATP synthase subunit F [Chloroflexi bacterium]|nr:V-type ATP synthase subunit F [Chloroflexota bacterium]MCK4262827.1 V-type ATP synthase subunit F [Dehalococcoidia bacterium]